MKILGIGSRIRHNELGVGVVTNVSYKHYTITFVDSGLETLPIDTELEVIEAVYDELDTVSLFDVEHSLTEILRKWSGMGEPVDLGERWKGGVLRLIPADSDLSHKELPIETFFHKIVMVRDRMRVLEQRINSHKGLSEDEKIDLQQYITRIYGSLTTFNVLFKHKSDQFTGDRIKG